jgi:D-threo-aldose 1-dehydrogenase
MPTMPTMRTRPIAGTALRTTELGLGAAALGNLYTAVGDEDARAAVDAAWDAGVRTFDVAPHYGLGLAEHRLGAALRDRPRDEYVLSTKVGRLLVPADPGGPGRDLAAGFDVPARLRRVWDFSADGVRRSLEESLQRLGLDRVDVVLVHDPDAHEAEALDGALPALAQLRSQGVVRAVGVGMNQSAMLARFVEAADLDLVLLAGRYTLLDQSALDDVLPAAVARGTSVLLGGVFNSGLLARERPPDDARHDYAPAPPSVLRRARQLADVCRAHGTTLPAAALHFALAHESVAGALVGMRSAGEVRRNVALLGEQVPAALWPDLRGAGLLREDAPTPRPLATR